MAVLAVLGVGGALTNGADGWSLLCFSGFVFSWMFGIRVR